MKNLTLLFFIILSKFSLATHIIGGEIFYDSLGNGNYNITLKVYRDCFNGLAQFDDPLQFTVFNTDGSIFNVFDFNLNSVTVLPYESEDKCVIPPTDFCVELGLYSNTINLPSSPTGYIIAYSRCCWSNNILNIQNPGDNGLTITSFIPPSTIVNSNPRFVNAPPLILCSNRTLEFDHSATDPDGDSLSYKIITPFSGGDPNFPIPNPEPPPPFPFNTWETGFSTNLAFGNNSIAKIDSITGILTFKPNLVGNFVLAVEVSEYRNGVLLSVKSRTFGYRVVLCALIPPIEVEIFSTSSQSGGAILTDIEGCTSSGFVISRDNADLEVNIQIILSGTAINGVDYQFIDSSLIMPENVFLDSIKINSFYDNLEEDTESVFIQVIITSPCDESLKDSTSATVQILNYKPLSSTFIDYIEVCDQDNNEFIYGLNINNGVEPYLFNWNNNSFANNDTINIPAEYLKPKLNNFNLTVTDACEKELSVGPIVLNNECKLQVPNFITIDGNSTNDFFKIKSNEYYDQVSLSIFNRWGKLVYKNSNYQNEWQGTDNNGNQLTEGVYFYQVSPVSEKYIYDEKEKLKYTIQGFVHLIRAEK